MYNIISVSRDTIEKILNPIDSEQLEIYYNIANGIGLFQKGLNAKCKDPSYKISSLNSHLDKRIK